MLGRRCPVLTELDLKQCVYKPLEAAASVLFTPATSALKGCTATGTPAKGSEVSSGTTRDEKKSSLAPDRHQALCILQEPFNKRHLSTYGTPLGQSLNMLMESM